MSSSDELREKVARVLANAMGEIGDDVWKFYLREADAAIALIRAETLEEAAKAVEETIAYSTPQAIQRDNCAAAIRAMKDKP